MVGFDLDKWLDSILRDRSLDDREVLQLITLGRELNVAKKIVFAPIHPKKQPGDRHQGVLRASGF